MAAVHQTMATVHQSLAPPAHALSIYGPHFSRKRASPSPARRMLNPAHKHIWVVAGTSCCGKTTIAEALARQLGSGDYIEGDDFHTPENRRKMSEGTPLTDDDRAPWLNNLEEIAVKSLKSSANVVVTCSSLKKKYRDIFRRAELKDSRVRVHFIFLIAPESVLVERAASRAGHFFKGSDMIKSQFATLEMPHPAEEMDVLLLDCTRSQLEVGANVWNRVLAVLTADRK